MTLSRREFVALMAAGPALRLQSAAPYDLVVRGGTVFDGSGAEGRVADIAIRRGRIAAVAAGLRSRGVEEIDAKGLAVGPGFIDIHSHADGTLFDDPSAESVIRQGVTTAVIGQDGGGRLPGRDGTTTASDLFARFEALPVAVNLATMIGLGAVRRTVVGEANRAATRAEVVRMTRLVEAALAAGACGASAGLEYAPGAFASRAELTALCRPLAARRLPYAPHMRNEDDTLLEAIDESVAIARGAGCPLHLSHLKTGGARNWGKIDAVFERIASARRAGIDTTFDRYPYVAWATGLTNMFPIWSQDGGVEAFLRRLDDPATAARLKGESLEKVELVGGWHAVQISNVDAESDQDAEGKRLDDWARARRLDPYDAALVLLRNNRTNVSIVVFAMSEDNLERFLAHPKGMVCSDGGSFAESGPARVGHPHPRGLGTFPRVLGRYVRERKALTLGQAIHKMSGMPAARLRLAGRGTIAVGAAADLVVFDPERVADRATFDSPFQYPVGIPTVIVNGAVALRNGERVGKGTGKGLRPNVRRRS
ncbi:MAG: D-aminoacylase [Gemmatimonadales bacterium]|nr:D-aminoacylase [Gemmatimonadales bacterium]